jgi:dienelactone hydrolase
MHKHFMTLIAIIAGTAAATGVAAEDRWAFTRDITLVSKWNIKGHLGQDTVTAELFRPKIEGRIPAAVIINSSGGVGSRVEPYYARLLASHGVAALVVDSFMPRGVRRTVGDQSLVGQDKSDADAVAGFRWLAEQPWVDQSRIIVMGMSRGGEAALHSAQLVNRRWLRAEDIRFAAHIAIVPGGCQIRVQDARTTGAPIFFMLAELDDYTPSRPCLEYLEQMRAAGNPNVRFAVYYGIYHAFELTAGVIEEHVERWKSCRYDLDRNGRWIDPKTGQQLPFAHERAAVLRTCLDQGPVTVGGDDAAFRQAEADLLQFLRDFDVIEDAEARVILPDCAKFPEGIIRRNCARARAGWVGDLVAMARHYRTGSIKRDDTMAVRLLTLAADRGHPQAKWELADMYRLGLGVTRDPARARSLAQSAAAQGEAAAMNILGVMERDQGTPQNDAEAVRWFRAAAELHNSYALNNLGDMYRHGRGGLALDRAEAVRLYRHSAYYENPWGRLHLAEALEKGDGTNRDLAQAFDLYKSVAADDREPEAKRRAQEALARLGAASSAPTTSPKQ